MIKTEIESGEIQTKTPTVSVIIPAYDAAKYIGDALKSVFNQTFTSYEVIVINDGSADTLELERELRPYLERIEYIKQPNRGAAAARNAGLRCAKGELVAFLDADDTWLPTFLEKQIDFLTSRNADLVYSDAMLFGDSPSAGRTFMEVQPPRGDVTPESLLAVDVTVLTSAVLARKDPILEVGLFDEDMKRGHDFDLWFRLAKLGARFAYQRELLARHRILETGLSGNAISKLQRTVAVLEAVKAKGTLTPTEHDALNSNMDTTLRELALETGKERLLCRDFKGALQSFNEAKRFRHSWKLLLVTLGVKIAPETLWRLYSRRNGGSKRN